MVGGCPSLVLAKSLSLEKRLVGLSGCRGLLSPLGLIFPSGRLLMEMPMPGLNFGRWVELLDGLLDEAAPNGTTRFRSDSVTRFPPLLRALSEEFGEKLPLGTSGLEAPSL